MCIVLGPGTAGEVLKWNVIVVRSDTVAESAGMLFTVKPPGPPPSTGQLTLTLKSVGGGKKNVRQGALITTQVSVADGVGVGVGVAGVPNSGVGGGVRVGVAVGVTTGDSSGTGAIAREELITAAVKTTTAAAPIANVVARLIALFGSHGI
jgi:hypothetical protein